MGFMREIVGYIAGYNVYIKHTNGLTKNLDFAWDLMGHRDASVHLGKFTG
jgi:hypothetical protein